MEGYWSLIILAGGIVVSIVVLLLWAWWIDIQDKKMENDKGI